jgi:hypothetical protein
MSHESGTVIVRVAMPHGKERTEEASEVMRREPSVFVDAPACQNEDDCAELARLAYRKLVRRGD